MKAFDKMRRFNNGQRITVVAADSPFIGESGTLVRLLRRSNEAWVNMDRDLPIDLRSFPDGDERKNHVCLWPQDCQPEVKL